MKEKGGEERWPEIGVISVEESARATGSTTRIK